ncbi:hypothetical protein [Mesorhizobium sp. B1-1-7]|uniref:hypothetical protein n=1 Tax=Mesorhizobium sp. B1-1-7 TaxID=2589977 RepID=UPI0011279A93|nr:hypothetical protein [Mesorhizobium sp. B1-1-7]TPN51519.1 hypothetical protein FJ978_14505 [Mesorhizobium sp. B1-1-7]
MARQTSYQYGFNAEARGARQIPAEKLDRLRTAAVRAIHDHWDRGKFPWLTREQRTWIVLGAGLELLLETTQPAFGASHAARHCGSCMPGKENVNPGFRLPPDEALCVEWLEWRHGGLVTKADAMAVTAVDEYLVERVGLEMLPSWSIQPTAEQVAALKDIHERRFSMLRKPAPPKHGGLMPRPRAQKAPIPLTGEGPKPKKWPDVVRWSIGPDGKPQRQWVPGFTVRGDKPAAGWVTEGTPEETEMKRGLEGYDQVRPGQ